MFPAVQIYFYFLSTPKKEYYTYFFIARNVWNKDFSLELHCSKAHGSCCMFIYFFCFLSFRRSLSPYPHSMYKINISFSFLRQWLLQQHPGTNAACRFPAIHPLPLHPSPSTPPALQPSNQPPPNSTIRGNRNCFAVDSKNKVFFWRAG